MYNDDDDDENWNLAIRSTDRMEKFMGMAVELRAYRKFETDFTHE